MHKLAGFKIIVINTVPVEPEHKQKFVLVTIRETIICNKKSEYAYLSCFTDMMALLIQE